MTAFPINPVPPVMATVDGETDIPLSTGSCENPVISFIGQTKLNKVSKIDAPEQIESNIVAPINIRNGCAFIIVDTWCGDNF